MVENKIIVCPICGKRTYLRIQVGGYLHEYPIRVHCLNCRALLQGVFSMGGKPAGLWMLNAVIEECDVDPHATEAGLASSTRVIRNADYVAEVSGELPCKTVVPYTGGIPISPFLKSADRIKSVEALNDRLSAFSANMVEWGRTKSIAFQLLSEGSISFIPKALSNKLGKYSYACDHYLKALHCLEDVMVDQSSYLFGEQSKEESSIQQIITELSRINSEELHQFCISLGGCEELVRQYRRAVEVFSKFMQIYPNVLPAETYLNFQTNIGADTGISTCSYTDIKSFYQDAYEALLSLAHIPVCLDNLIIRNNFQQFHERYNNVKKGNGVHSLAEYKELDNGTRINKYNASELFQGMVGIPSSKDNRLLRNGISHNNVEYDGITQTILVFEYKNPNKVELKIRLMDMAIDCIRLVKASVLLSEIILFLLRVECRRENITTLIHPRLYRNIEPNQLCPCGSMMKFKKCCRSALDALLYNGKG